MNGYTWKTLLDEFVPRTMIGLEMLKKEKEEEEKEAEKIKRKMPKRK